MLRLSKSLIAGLAGLGAFAWAQAPQDAVGQTYPSEPITMVVARTPGGASDVIARLLAPPLQEVLGVPVVVENRPGGEGYVAWRQLAAGEPNGYEVLMAENALAMTTALRPEETLDPRTDFDAVALVARAPMSVIVHKGLGIDTLEELIALANSKEGGINYSSSGIGSVSHMTFGMLVQALGIEAQHVPYRGGGEANAAVMAGHVDAMMSNVGAAARLRQEGGVEVVAVDAPERMNAISDVPTLEELGVEVDLDLALWWGLFVAPGTPDEIKETLADAMRQVLEDPETQQRLANVDMVPTFGDADELAQRLDEDIRLWGAFVEEAGIVME